MILSSIIAVILFLLMLTAFWFYNFIKKPKLYYLGFLFGIFCFAVTAKIGFELFR